MRPFYSVIAFILLLIAGCKSASKAYEQGNYGDAIELAIKKLKKNPNDEEARTLIQKSYPYVVNQYEDQIHRLSNSTSDNRWEQIYHQYNQLQQLYQAVNNYPQLASLVKATDYSSYVQLYRDKAAEAHIIKAESLMQAGDKHAFRQAYQEYKAALTYQPNDPVLTQKMREAYDLGLIKVAVAPVELYSRYPYGNATYLVRRFEDNILRDLNNQNISPFVRFFPEWEARNQQVVPDELLDMRFNYITIGRPYDESSTRRVSKEVVDKEIVYSKDSVVKQYRTVYARITVTRRTLVSEAELAIAARETNGRILWSDVVGGQHHWQVEFATFTGDERALSSNDRALLNRTHYDVPREDEIVAELLRQVEANLAGKVRYYYSRY